MSDATLPGFRENVPLASLTTIELGGAARYLIDLEDEVGVEDVVRWASHHGFPLSVLGGGSNVVVADRGVRGLVMRIGIRGLSMIREGGFVKVTVGAGEPWDGVVSRTVAEELAGLECLSGIPGTAGATPLQNVGAYGQDVSQVIEEVRVFDRYGQKRTTLTNADCGFGYRTSDLRSDPNRYIVLGVVFRLRPGGAPTLGYPEVARALDTAGFDPTLSDTRSVVLELRRAKSMCIEADDPNRRSVGSFFVNPEIDNKALPEVAEAAAVNDDAVPSFPSTDDRIKVPAAWLIERAGYSKGIRRGGWGSRPAIPLP